MNNTDTDGDLTRRDFIKGGSMATLASLLGGIELTALAAEPEPAKSARPKTKCAVIGLGVWGREMVSTLARLPSAELAAICDTYPAYLKRTARSAPGAAQIEDYRKILEDKEIPAVIVATPTHLHREIVLNAIQAGKHVYCEAPLAATIDDARAIALAAKNSPTQHFQAGLQLRADKHRQFVLNFIRSGARGKAIMARAQCLKKQSWRQTSPNPDREKEMNWRLDPALSLGMVGELGIHQVDACTWVHDALPLAVSGFGSLVQWKDGREIPDTTHTVIEYPNGVRFVQTCCLANSFEGDYEVYHGTDGTIMFVGSKAWLFKEADAPLLGWEVYARKDSFYQETGIALMMDASKQASLTQKATEEAADAKTPLYYALENFLQNSDTKTAEVQSFKDAYGDDPEDLREHCEKMLLLPAASYLQGFRATVLAVKAHEAVMKGQRIDLKPEWFELS